MEKYNASAGSLLNLYARPSSFNKPISNSRVGNYQNTMLSRADTMNRLSDKGIKRMLNLFGTNNNDNVTQLINTHSRAGGTQVIN